MFPRKSTMPQETSTSTDQDKRDHPILYTLVNMILWVVIIVFVAFPFGLCAAVLNVIVRVLAVICYRRDLVDLGDFLEMSQFIPELCVVNCIENQDFVRFLDLSTRTGIGAVNINAQQ